eukprot:m.185842 g.185842  ORF g.185842 m.185842 type:complete len:94 (-) comp15040_c0_seq8:1788-2069(-)
MLGQHAVAPPGRASHAEDGWAQTLHDAAQQTVPVESLIPCAQVGSGGGGGGGGVNGHGASSHVAAFCASDALKSELYSLVKSFWHPDAAPCVS